MTCGSGELILMGSRLRKPLVKLVDSSFTMCGFKATSLKKALDKLKKIWYNNYRN
jgi:hypothetical protein